MTRAATPKVRAGNVRIPAPAELDTAAKGVGMFCSVCGVKPRGAGGRLTRCLDCLTTDVDRERQHLEAIVRKSLAWVVATSFVKRRQQVLTNGSENGNLADAVRTGTADADLHAASPRQARRDRPAKASG